MTTMATGSSAARGEATLKLPQLQNLCKRDPASHRDDYDAQVRRLQSEISILTLSSSQGPSSSSSSHNSRASPDLVELIQFVAAVSSSSYKGDETDRISRLLWTLLVGEEEEDGDDEKKDNAPQAEFHYSTLSTHLESLPREVRKACVSALVSMRHKGTVAAPIRLWRTLFRVFVVVSSNDKSLTQSLYRYLVNDVRRTNKKGKHDDRLHRSVRAFLHKVLVSISISTNSNTRPDELVARHDQVAARAAVDIVCDLYRRRVWTDERTVSIVESAVRSPCTNVMSRAVRFFLNIEEKMQNDRESQEDEIEKGHETIDFHRHSVKTKKRTNQIKRKVATRAKFKKKKEQNLNLTDETLIFTKDRGVAHAKKLYPAIELLNDPQGLAEHVLKRIKSHPNSKSSSSGRVSFEAKLLLINFVTRLVGNHRLLLLPLYPLLQRYLGTYQRDVTAILAYTVQACHDLVPPEDVVAVLQSLAHNFLVERCTEEQMAVGLNAARAICARVPSVLTDTTSFDPEAWAQDLAGYARHRDRSVQVAGRAWTNFLRDTYPSLLRGQDRGAAGAALHRSGTAKPNRYGETRAAAGVEGADLWMEYEDKKKKRQMMMEEEEGDEEGGDEPMQDGTTDQEDVENDDEKDEEGAPTLVNLDENGVAVDKDDNTNDLHTMSTAQREQVQQEVSSNRVFSTEELIKMRKLVAREEQLRRDPRYAAKRKRAIAQQGDDFELLSDDDSDDDDNINNEDDQIRTHGVVNLTDIMAVSKKKRMNKLERLEKIVEGRDKYQTKARAGGATNTEKIRNKSFVMTKFSLATRTKLAGKGTKRKAQQKQNMPIKGSKKSRKRRRKIG